MVSEESTPLSLRPVPVADRKPKNLAEFIARINAQPGGFRGLTETKLREEAVELENGNSTAEDDDVDMSNGEDEGEAEEPEAPTRDPAQVRNEVLAEVEQASKWAGTILETLSLLLSKQNPTLAGMTLSKQLREVTGIGTLGASRLDEPNITPAQEKEQEEIAQGWTLMEIQKTSDAAEAACSFLSKEVDVESKYWEEAVKVQQNGWSLCKMPQERHTLGVRFGFSESAPEFKNNGLAPMRRGDDGSVQLDCGRLGGVSERIVVTYERDGKVVGRSSIPAQTDQSAPLEKRVLEARNTLFSQELWHELNREARNLAAYDVRPEGSSLTCKLDESTKLRIDLATLDSTPSTSEESPDQNVAETISQVLHLLLCYSHTQNELGRTRPIPPHLPRSRGQQIYPLLRPIIARALHLQGVKSSSKYIGTLVQCLKNAGIKASFSLHTPPPFTLQSQPNLANQPSPPNLLIRHLLNSTNYTLKLTLLPDVSLTIRSRTAFFPFTSTYFYVIVPPSSPLERICPPFRDGYPDVKTLSEYLQTATCRLLAEHFLAEIPEGLWVANIKGDSLRPADNDESDLRFIIQDKEPNSPTLVVKSTKATGQNSNTEEWEWRSSSTESESTPLADIVKGVIGQKTS
ncbi:unnamed protein product [Clonostachys rosea]|uniref:Mediator of RNA polymerase II transcription subunit 17 n=1 Tax=Bionectria ochroleuca TaxID=29856 RepID=A0ABY6UGK5_BIOOC|nr:unnamed protein product [Clonostachys rosea]